MSFVSVSGKHGSGSNIFCLIVSCKSVAFLKVDMKRKFLFSHMKVHEKQE